MNETRLVRWAGLTALVAGLLFMAIQPIHPPETITSVATSRWAMVHYVTLVMTILFGTGIAGIYARQVREVGWLGLAGVVTLELGLIITGALVFVEAFISPVLVESEPEFVSGLLGMVSGSGASVDLGGLGVLWNVSGLLFPLGCLLFGTATLRARILPRAASAVFAFGLPVAVATVSLLPGDLHRLGALPVGLGLAWLGHAVWADRHALPVDGATPARTDRLVHR